MSADNGIYIAKFPLDRGGFEYRVAHCQNIEDCFAEDQDNADACTFSYFELVPTFSTSEGARLKAEVLAKNYDVLEYGISEIWFEESFAKIAQRLTDAPLRAERRAIIEAIWALPCNSTEEQDAYAVCIKMIGARGV